ncbi:MAG: hypothetical protein KAS94_05480 [Desulfobulbaceae bacterium]|nr:hypothetical protein [Desulfobulbaceae bacterium]
MKKIITTIFLTGLFVGIFSYPASALDGWESSVTVTSGNAESRLSYGQKADATDLTDGLYDVPAMLSGAIQVYFQNEEESFWRDIRAIGPNSEWQLIITSHTGKPVVITWDSDNLPQDAEVRLIDTENGQEVDMKSFNSYSLGSTDSAVLVLEITTD